MMRTLGRCALLAGCAALSGSGLAADAPQGPAPQGPAPPQTPAPQVPKVCLDARTGDALTEQFADRLRQAIAASRALMLAATVESCSLQLHIPGNLLRFETAGAVMVSTVVIVTSPSDRYLSASVAACAANDLQPCAARAVAAAKLALLASPPPE